MRQMSLWVALAVAALATSEISAQVFAQSAPDAEIAPMGKLRYGLNASNAALSARAPDGSVSGISIDLGTFVAGRLGAALEPVAYPSTGDFTRSFDKELLGKLDVYGSNTNNLLLVAERLPGATFVPGAFFTVHFAVATPKARSPAAQQRLAAIVKDATTTGLLQNAIEKAGLKGVRVPTN